MKKPSFLTFWTLASTLGLAAFVPAQGAVRIAPKPDATETKSKSKADADLQKRLKEVIGLLQESDLSPEQRAAASKTLSEALKKIGSQNLTWTTTLGEGDAPVIQLDKGAYRIQSDAADESKPTARRVMGLGGSAAGSVPARAKKDVDVDVDVDVEAAPKTASGWVVRTDGGKNIVMRATEAEGHAVAPTGKYQFHIVEDGETKVVAPRVALRYLQDGDNDEKITYLRGRVAELQKAEAAKVESMQSWAETKAKLEAQRKRWTAAKVESVQDLVETKVNLQARKAWLEAEKAGRVEASRRQADALIVERKHQEEAKQAVERALVRTRANERVRREAEHDDGEIHEMIEEMRKEMREIRSLLRDIQKSQRPSPAKAPKQAKTPKAVKASVGHEHGEHTEHEIHVIEEVHEGNSARTVFGARAAAPSAPAAQTAPPAPAAPAAPAAPSPRRMLVR